MKVALIYITAFCAVFRLILIVALSFC